MKLSTRPMCALCPGPYLECLLPEGVRPGFRIGFFRLAGFVQASLAACARRGVLRCGGPPGVTEKKWWCAAFLALLMGSPALAGQEAVRDASLVDDQISVRELMRLETAIALEAARSRQKQHLRAEKAAVGFPVQAAGVAAVSASGPRLLAIYGVGKNLWAEVLIRQVPVLYRQGHPAPVGIKLSDAVFRLKGITPRCVELESAGGAEQLCLGPG